MTFSAGRRVASPFAQRAAQHAQNIEETPDISTIPDPIEPKDEPAVADAPEVLEEHPEVVDESNNQEVENDASDEAQEPTSEQVETDKPAKGRGRPRVAEVKERDEKILAEITAHEAHTRASLEEALDMTQNEVYMSLFRLRTAGKIEKRRIDGKHAWFAVDVEVTELEA